MQIAVFYLLGRYDDVVEILLVGFLLRGASYLPLQWILSSWKLHAHLFSR